MNLINTKFGMRFFSINYYINLPAFKIVKYFWWSSLFVISIVPQLFVNVAILLVFNKENEILGFYWVQQTSLVYPHVGIHPWVHWAFYNWGVKIIWCLNMWLI